MSNLQGREFETVSTCCKRREKHIINNCLYCFVDSKEPKEMKTILSALVCGQKAYWAACIIC